MEGFKMTAPVISNGNPKFRTAPVVLASAMAFGDNGGSPTNVTQATPLPIRTAGGEYETVAASQTAQVMGGTGAIGDYIHGILVIPALVACGVVTLLDGATSIPVFVGGGTTALADAKPFWIPLGLTSVVGAWKITTGASVSCIAVGDFAA
jgi:hypothetical protein